MLYHFSRRIKLNQKRKLSRNRKPNGTKKYKEHLTLILNIIERINDFLPDLYMEMNVIHYWVKGSNK